MTASRPSNGTPRGVWSVVRAVLDRMGDHNVTVAAAGIAFYGLLALVPTLIALVSVYSLVADPNDITEQVGDIAGSLDDSTREFLVDQLTDVVGQVEDGETGAPIGGRIGGQIGRWIALILGIALALFSSSGAVQKMMSTISLAYEADEGRPGWKVRALAYGFTAAVIVGVAIMILAIAVIPVVLAEVDMGDTTRAAINVLRMPVLGVMFAIALTVLYRHSPDRERRTPWWNPGAVVGTVLFVLFAIAFSIYTSSVDSLPGSYGLLGSIAALMIFLQLTALAVIIGAEVNAELESRAAEASEPAPATGAGLPSARVAAAARGEGEPFGLGTAVAGLAALFALDRASSSRR